MNGKLAHFLVLILAPVVVVGLLAMALVMVSPAGADEEPPGEVTEFSWVTEDGRTVTCLHYDRGVTCDWGYRP